VAVEEINPIAKAFETLLVSDIPNLASVINAHSLDQKAKGHYPHKGYRTLFLI
jgi:hypothetical protein